MADCRYWYYLAPDGCYYGPAAAAKLEHWLRRGKIPHSTPIAPSAHGPYFPATHYWHVEAAALKTRINFDSWYFRLRDHASEPEQGPFSMLAMYTRYNGSAATSSSGEYKPEQPGPLPSEMLRPDSMIRLEELSLGDYCLQDVWPQWDQVFRMPIQSEDPSPKARGEKEPPPVEEETFITTSTRTATSTLMKQQQQEQEQKSSSASPTLSQQQEGQQTNLRPAQQTAGEEVNRDRGQSTKQVADGQALLGEDDQRRGIGGSFLTSRRIEGDWFYGDSGESRLRITDGMEVSDYWLSLFTDGGLEECQLNAEPSDGWCIGRLESTEERSDLAGAEIAVRRVPGMIYCEVKIKRRVSNVASGWQPSVFAWPRYSFELNGVWHGPFSNTQCRNWYRDGRFDKNTAGGRETKFRLGNDLDHRMYTLRELFPPGVDPFSLDALPVSSNPGREPTIIIVEQQSSSSTTTSSSRVGQNSSMLGGESSMISSSGVGGARGRPVSNKVSQAPPLPPEGLGNSNRSVNLRDDGREEETIYYAPGQTGQFQTWFKNYYGGSGPEQTQQFSGQFDRDRQTQQAQSQAIAQSNRPDPSMMSLSKDYLPAGSMNMSSQSPSGYYNQTMGSQASMGPLTASMYNPNYPQGNARMMSRSHLSDESISHRDFASSRAGTRALPMGASLVGYKPVNPSIVTTYV
ncbi:unnamed protein product [Amoebophrya sp. A25]|nr:unnamed protein product [Amoebophrya sp. A25]|eukprot:GSA25T00007343001.1